MSRAGQHECHSFCRIGPVNRHISLIRECSAETFWLQPLRHSERWASTSGVMSGHTQVDLSEDDVLRVGGLLEGLSVDI